MPYPLNLLLEAFALLFFLLKIAGGNLPVCPFN